MAKYTKIIHFYGTTVSAVAAKTKTGENGRHANAASRKAQKFKRTLSQNEEPYRSEILQTY